MIIMVAASKRSPSRPGGMAHTHGEVLYAAGRLPLDLSMGDLESLFPAIGGTAYVKPDRGGHPWPAEAMELADSLLRVEALAGLPEGIVGVGFPGAPDGVRRAL